MASLNRVSQVNAAFRFNVFAFVFFGVVTALIVCGYYYFPATWPVGGKTPDRIATLTNTQDSVVLREMLTVCLTGEYGDGLAQRNLIASGLALASSVSLIATGLFAYNVAVLRRLAKSGENRDL